jgi:hypothetical protein
MDIGFSFAIHRLPLSLINRSNKEIIVNAIKIRAF